MENGLRLLVAVNKSRGGEFTLPRRHCSLGGVTEETCENGQVWQKPQKPIEGGVCRFLSRSLVFSMTLLSFSISFLHGS